MISTTIAAKLCGFMFVLVQSPAGSRCASEVDYKSCTVSARCEGDVKSLTCSKHQSPELVMQAEVFYTNGHWKAKLECSAE